MAAKKQPEIKLLSGINDAIKNLGPYSWCPDSKIFYGRDHGCQFLYSTPIDSSLDFPIKSNFHVKEGAKFATFLKASTELSFDKLVCKDQDDNEFPFEIAPNKLNEQNYTVLTVVNREEDELDYQYS